MMRRRKLDHQEAKKQIQAADHRKKIYYSSFSGKKWGTLENYHACIDSSRHELENIVKTLCFYIKSSHAAETLSAYADGVCMADSAAV